jgi:hypothetical protein
MRKDIIGFRKTYHFLKRQWERSIDDDFLKKVLFHVDKKVCQNILIELLPSFLKNNGFKKHLNKSLVIVIRRGVLITCFCSENTGYSLKRDLSNHVITLN